MTSPSQLHETVHSRVVAAPAQVVYDLVADVTRWPVIFEPTVHVRHLERGPDSERFQLWAWVNGEVSTWTSRRTLDPVRRRVTFAQDSSAPPLATMSGEWMFHELPGGATEVVLTHRFSMLGGAEDVAWMRRALDTNSERELGALARVGELEHPVDELVFSFTDEVRLPGPVADVYEFVNRADLWPERLPHVSRVSLREPRAGIQDMEMDTVTADGSAHTTRSVRLCSAPEEIVYKQVVLPALLSGHSGSWTFAGDPDGTTVTARHTVAIDPAAIAGVLGQDRTPADARAYLREALGRNSRATLLQAGEYTRRQAAEADVSR